MKLKRGSTSVRRLIFIGDSSSTTGGGLTGLVYNSASLVAYYFAGDLSNEVAISLASATLGTFTSGGFVEVDATNMPGWYEIGIPDAALDAGNEVAIQLRGATDMVPVNIYIELDTVDYQTAAFGANTVVPATPANVTTALEDMDLDKALIAQGAERAVNVDVSHRVHSHVYDMQANTITASALAADAGAEIYAAFGTGSNLTALATQASVNDIPTNAEFAAAFPANFASLGINVSGHVSRVTLVDTTTTNTDMRGTDSALTTKTGFALSATGLDLVTAWTTDITGSLSGNVGGIAGTINTLDALDTAQDTQHGTTQDRLGYTLAALAGACADAGTAAETYAITIGVDTYTIDHTGLDATGNRGTATLTKS
jgi:hypothetical protein